MKFAESWGYGGVIMTNLFAYRTKNPRAMINFEGDAIGPENDKYIEEGILAAHISIAGWGQNGSHLGRDKQVEKLNHELYCLKLTKKWAAGATLCI